MKNLLHYCLFLGALLMSQYLLAQTITSFGPISAKPHDDLDDVPIDGGLSLLIAAGVGYGARKKL